MIDAWRELLYPLGFLSSFAFCARFLVQWITSEIKKESVVTALFWKLSLVGNLLLLAHSLIQVQLHVGLVQTCNAVISWRNLNLMGPAEGQLSKRRTLQIFLAAMGASLSLFLLQSYFFTDRPFELFRVPITPWHRGVGGQIAFTWHLLGLAGLILFNARFWVQWWGAERRHQSFIGPSFWWISLVGDTLCLAYFARLGDPVNLIGPLFGLIPYVRNLMLLRKPASTRNVP